MRKKMWLVGLAAAMPMLMAAWPDTYQNRRVAIAAFQHDLLTPELLHDDGMVEARYEAACKQKFTIACQFQEWQGEAGADVAEVAAIFAKKCSGEPLACAVSGWAMSRVDGVVSPEASNPAGAFKNFRKACTKDLYAPACTGLGELYLEGVGTTADEARGVSYIVEGCEGEDWWGCYELGELYAEGRGVESSPEQAFAYHDQACSEGVVMGCVRMATSYETGIGVAADISKAAELYGQGCRERHIASCYELGRLYAEGSGVSGSSLVAMGLYQTACDAGDLRGCYGIGVLYEMGLGVEADPEIALGHYNQTCEIGFAPACTRLGWMYLGGKAVEKDRRLGLSYVNRGCKAGDLEGCVTMAEMYEDGRWGTDMNLTRAFDLYNQACTGGSGAGCYHLGRLYDEGKGVPANQREALTWYRKSCEAGYGEGCGRLAEKFRIGEGVVKNSREAIRYLQLGCESAHGASCGGLAGLYESGMQGLTRDLDQAALFYERACNLQDPTGCWHLGRFYEEGSTLEQDFVAALTAYELACEGDVEEACAAAEPIAFRARFEQVIQTGFESNICEIWSFDLDDPEKNRLLAEVRGSQVTLLLGRSKNKIATISHLRNEFNEGSSRVAASFWAVDIEGRAWEDEIEHHEVWDAENESVSAFPGDESFSRDPRGSSSLLFSRDEETVRRNEENRCKFVGGVTRLSTEQCSEVQALVTANLLSTCR
ncbi:MAG: TPR repeat protein [Myxococcota bacterium]|jgi:TPR repeat protein